MNHENFHRNMNSIHWLINQHIYESNHSASSSKTKNKHDKNQCGHNTHKVSDHHLHYKCQWLAATTPHWLHQPLMLGVDKSTVIWSNFEQNDYTKICILLCFWSNKNTMSSYHQLALEDISSKAVNSTLIQAATSLWRKASVFESSPCPSKHLT